MLKLGGMWLIGNKWRSGLKLQNSIMKFFRVFISLVVSFLFFSLSWFIFVDGKLYYCSDKVPFLDFFPPFVHIGQFGPTGDYFIISPVEVWLVWYLFIIGIVLSTYLLF